MSKEVSCEFLLEEQDPVLFGPQQLVSSTKLVRNMSSYLNMAQKKPVFVEREQEVEAVLISIDSYRDLLREEQKVKDLYLTVKAFRRLIEHLQSGDSGVSLDEMMAEFELSKEELMGVR